MPTKSLVRPIPCDPRFWEFCANVIPYNYCSQFGEDAIIEAIFAKTPPVNKWAFEVGAHDGVFCSNTRRLIEVDGWSAVLVEASDDLFPKLHEQYWANPHVFTVHRWIDDRTTIDAVIAGLGVPPDLDLLIIDIDGQDYWVLNDLQSRPRVLIVEFSPYGQEPERFIPARNGEGQAGEIAISELMATKGYIPICKTMVNLIAIRGDLVEMIDG